MKVVAVANQKGGVAKTTSTVNIAHALHRAGAKVLAIDCDPQGSLSIACGIDPMELAEMDASGKTLYHGLAKDVPLEELIVRREDRPALIPAFDSLEDAENDVRSEFGVASVMRKKMLPLRKMFDVIMLDCPPRRGFLTINALTAADLVLVPYKTDFLSVMGIARLMQTIDAVRTNANPDLQVMGLLPTIYAASAGHDNKILARLRDIGAHNKLRVFGPVHRATAFDRSAVEGRAAVDASPSTPGVDVYVQIARELFSDNKE